MILTSLHTLRGATSGEKPLILTVQGSRLYLASSLPSAASA